MKTIAKKTPIIAYEDMHRLKEEFQKNKYVKLPGFFTKDKFKTLFNEAIHLLDTYSKRKDFLMEDTEFTPRKISTVSGNVIFNESSMITELYQEEELIAFLEEISGDKLFPTPDIADRHAIHRLHKKNDIHGGHVDTYPFVLITCLESPGKDGGGELEYVPNSLDIKDLGTDKAVRGYLDQGESYFMRASDSVHRVLPLKKEVNRTVVVFTYADEVSKDIIESYSSNLLYD